MNASTSSIQLNSRPSLPQGPGACFKTSNPQIFPSLHPLSNFYREKTKPAPKPAPQAPQVDFEPVKKVKMNDYCQAVVPRATVIDLPVKVQGQEKISNQKLDYDFAVPKMPSRFNVKNKKQPEIQTNAIEAPKLQEEDNFVSDSLIIPESIYKNVRQLQMQQQQPAGFIVSKPVNKSEMSWKNETPLRIPIAQRPVMSQFDMLLALNLKFAEERMMHEKMDLFSHQLRQAMPHLFQICEQNCLKL